MSHVCAATCDGWLTQHLFVNRFILCTLMVHHNENKLLLVMILIVVIILFSSVVAVQHLV